MGEDANVAFFGGLRRDGELMGDKSGSGEQMFVLDMNVKHQEEESTLLTQWSSTYFADCEDDREGVGQMFGRVDCHLQGCADPLLGHHLLPSLESQK